MKIDTPTRIAVRHTYDGKRVELWSDGYVILGNGTMAAAEETLRRHVESEGGRAYLLLGGNVVWGCERCGGDVVWAGGSSENDVNRMLAGMTY